MQCTIQKRKTEVTLVQIMPLERYLNYENGWTTISEEEADYIATFKDAANNYFTYVIKLKTDDADRIKTGIKVPANILVVYDEVNRSPRTLITDVSIDF